MILSIGSSLSTFRPIRFHSGLNILLSDRSPGSSERQTRNSAGKTSLVEVIHFLLGAKCDSESLFRTPALVEHSFNGEFEFWGTKVHIERTGSKPSRVYVLSGLANRDDVDLRVEKDTQRTYITNEKWKDFLAHIMFGFPSDLSSSIYGESYTPSFRSMISYFVRRANSGGFERPELCSRNQQVWDWQENLSYLFGLDWRIPYEFEKVRGREKTLEELKKAAKDGVIGEMIGTVAELRSLVTVAERKASRRRTQLENFQVLESYGDLADRAARAKNEMQSLTRDSVGLRETLDYLKTAQENETPPDPEAVEKMYAAVGIELPGVALKRLDDVRRFYASVISNRKAHLADEIKQVSKKIDENTAKVSALDGERKQILQTLRSHGALEDFLSLQKELADLESEAATLRERFKIAEIMEGQKTELDIDRGNLHKRLQQDFQERRPQLDEAIGFVTEAIADLYEDREGKFEVAATDRGPRFTISIAGDRGTGISSLEIFCLDLALFKINLARGRGPGFLLHDSHLFDGVDERQIAGAIALGSEAVSGTEHQYIVTMNSDIFDRLPLTDDIHVDEVILPTRLSDTETGGLFGFRFD